MVEVPERTKSFSHGLRPKPTRRGSTPTNPKPQEQETGAIQAPVSSLIPPHPTGTGDAAPEASRRTRRLKRADSATVTACRPSHENLTNRREIVRNGIRGQIGRRSRKPSLTAKSGLLNITRLCCPDLVYWSHNPKVIGSNPIPATKIHAGQSRSLGTDSSVSQIAIPTFIPTTVHDCSAGVGIKASKSIIGTP